MISPSDPIPTRRQASLYLCEAAGIEALRWRFNPVQARLIPAHVTLCREDEVRDWVVLQRRLEAVPRIEVTLEFGTPVREGDSVYLPAVGDTSAFDALRRVLLLEGDVAPRKHRPHITIIHPRNGRCTDEVFREIVGSLLPFRTTFREVTLIEQRGWGEWRCVGLAPTADPASPASASSDVITP